jgi:hypothetical protein
MGGPEQGESKGQTAFNVDATHVVNDMPCVLHLCSAGACLWGLHQLWPDLGSTGQHTSQHWSALMNTLVSTGQHTGQHWSIHWSALGCTIRHWSTLMNTLVSTGQYTGQHWAAIVDTGQHTACLTVCPALA